MYYVIQNTFIFLIFTFILTKYEKDNDGFKKKILLKCIEMHVHAIFFNSGIFKIIYIFLVCRVLKKN